MTLDTLTPPAVPLSAAPYRGINLRLYDAFVLHFTSPRAWGCTRQELSEMYRRHMTADHAEVGVGSGRLLADQQGNVEWCALSLIDPNPAALNFVAKRLGDTAPVTRHVGDILINESLPRRRHRSVAANYVLHCLPNAGDSKRTAIANLADLTSDDGTLFGATVLGEASHNRLGRILMRTCNNRGMFDNASDNEYDLTQNLRDHFHSVRIERYSTVAMFTASRPIR